jgi:threonylcarbamoyladenosine tRNA methylthiotransferase MtaB
MKVYLDTIGCRLNQSEIETYARQFRAAGHSLVSTPEEADLVVVNTCAVTAAAASDSRQKIRQAARAGHAEIVVTGCWSTLNPQAAAGLPSVQRVVPNLEKDHLVPELLQIAPEAFELEPVARAPIPGARLRTRAFVKVQDGCNNRCTFCVTTIARGAGRSRALAEVLAEVINAHPAQEVVLTGVHLGSWGQDLGGLHLCHLVTAVLRETGVPRLRLSSLEPWDLDEDFFSLWEDRRLCRHLHLPLQSGSGATLRRMARKTTPAAFTALVEAARRLIPGVAITTDVIVGFPGESDAEFDESLQTVRALQLAGGHVFSYSSRPGTAAARMPEPVPVGVRRERSARMRAVLAESADHYQQGFIGQVLPVLWESTTALGSESWHMSGLTDNYLRVSARAPQQLWNQITPVRLLSSDGDGMTGQIAA